MNPSELYTVRIRHPHNLINWSYLTDLFTSMVALKIYTGLVAVWSFAQYLLKIATPY